MELKRQYIGAYCCNGDWDVYAIVGAGDIGSFNTGIKALVRRGSVRQ